MDDATTRLAQVVEEVRRRWGGRAARWGQEAVPDVPLLTTGTGALDMLLGGLPRGRVTELLGAPTSGMTTITLQLVAHAQAQGELVAWLDLASAFDVEYAARCNVDLHQLLLARPTTAPEALELLHALVDQRAIGLVVVDQLGMLQSHPEHAYLLNRALRGLLTPLASSPTALLALTTAPYSANMVRAIAFRGSLLAHAASLRLHFARTGWADDPLSLGCASRIVVLKDKIAGVRGEVILSLDFEAREVGV